MSAEGPTENASGRSGNFLVPSAMARAHPPQTSVKVWGLGGVSMSWQLSLADPCREFWEWVQLQRASRPRLRLWCTSFPAPPRRPRRFFSASEDARNPHSTSIDLVRRKTGRQWRRHWHSSSAEAPSAAGASWHMRKAWRPPSAGTYRPAGCGRRQTQKTNGSSAPKKSRMGSIPTSSRCWRNGAT